MNQEQKTSPQTERALATLAKYERIIHNVEQNSQALALQDWKDATLDISDAVRGLLRGHDLGPALKNDPELSSWKSLGAALDYRNRAAHPLAELPGVPLFPTPEQWYEAARVFFDAGTTIRHRWLLDKKGQLSDELERSTESLGAIFEWIAILLSNLGLTVVVAGLDAIGLEEIADPEAAKALERLKILLAETIKSNDVAATLAMRMPELVQNAIASIPLESRVKIIRDSKMAGSIIAADNRRKSSGNSVKDWVGWLMELIADKNNNKMFKHVEGRVVGILRTAKTETTASAQNIRGWIVTNIPKRLYAFAQSDSGEQYFVHYDHCDDKLRSLLARAIRGQEIHIIFDSVPPGDGGRHAAARNVKCADER